MISSPQKARDSRAENARFISFCTAGRSPRAAGLFILFVKAQVSLLLDDLSAFVCVANRGSFNKVGELLYLSANGVKNRMEELEAQIGVPLFSRSPRGVALTPAGRSFLQDARAHPVLP